MAAEEDLTQSEQCQRAVDAAVDVAIENHCTTDDARKQQFSDVLGVEPDADCEAALKEGLDEATCSDFRGIRQYVMCLAIQLVQDEGMQFSRAMRAAWEKARTECSARGVDL